MAGRKPQPTNLKIIKGNPGKRPLNKDEPKPKVVTPEPLAWLDPTAQTEWKRIVPILARLGLLTEIDTVAMAGYCKAFSRWKQAEEILDKSPSMMFRSEKNKYPCPMPHVSISQKYLQIMKGYLIEFGMTPSARSRLVAGKPDGEKDGFDF